MSNLILCKLRYDFFVSVLRRWDSFRHPVKSVLCFQRLEEHSINATCNTKSFGERHNSTKNLFIVVLLISLHFDNIIFVTEKKKKRETDVQIGAEQLAIEICFQCFWVHPEKVRAQKTTRPMIQKMRRWIFATKRVIYQTINQFQKGITRWVILDLKRR